MVYAVIIAGGKGRRLWPKSTPEHPKHLLPIISDKPMLEETIQRIESYIPRERVYIVTAEDSVEQIMELIPNLKRENVLGEPVGKNSAPAIAWASAVIAEHDPEAITVVLPADHFIPDEEKYLNDLKKAVSVAEKKPYLVTFGIEPTRPDTGYGYIELGDTIEAQIFRVNRFTEKPDYKTALEFLDAGNYRWNSGMFVWKVDTILNAFKNHRPTIHHQLTELMEHYQSPDYKESIIKFYDQVESISIDYAIMEKSDNVATVSASFRWDDVGSWQFLTRTSEPDDAGNYGHGTYIGLNTKNCIIYNDEDKLIATVDIEDLIIVNTPNGILVCDYSKAGNVNKIVKQIETLNI
jgi:mannose-1-phosphate guanylyltransferase